MAKSAKGTFQSAWGKASRTFATYLDLAGKTIGRTAARGLAEASAEFLANEDWDWPRGERYDAFHNGRNVRGSKTYASGYRGGDGMHPWYSGNLHDSIAVGIFNGPRLLAARYMQPGATEMQEYRGADVDGVLAGQNALRRYANRASGKSTRAVLFIGVPYADYIDTAPFIGWHQSTPNTHIGYAEYLQHEFYTTLLPKMLRLRKIKLRMKK